MSEEGEGRRRKGRKGGWYVFVGVCLYFSVYSCVYIVSREEKERDDSPYLHACDDIQEMKDNPNITLIICHTQVNSVYKHTQSGTDMSHSSPLNTSRQLQRLKARNIVYRCAKCVDEFMFYVASKISL